MNRFAVVLVAMLVAGCAAGAGAKKFGKMTDNDWVVTNAWQAMQHRVTPTSEWATNHFGSAQFSNEVNRVIVQKEGWTTNMVKDVVRSASVTNAGAVAESKSYTDYAISQIPQGTDTNAVQSIINKNVQTNYLCTVAAAQAKADAAEASARSTSVSAYGGTYEYDYSFNKVTANSTYGLYGVYTSPGAYIGWRANEHTAPYAGFVFSWPGDRPELYVEERYIGEVAVKSDIPTYETFTPYFASKSTESVAAAALPKAGGTMTGNLTVSHSGGSAIVSPSEVSVSKTFNGASNKLRLIMGADKMPQLGYYRTKSGEATRDYDYVLPQRSGKFALTSSTDLNELLHEANTNCASNAESESIKSNMTNLVKGYVDSGDEATRQIVYTWEGFLDGSNVVFSITNYISGTYNLDAAKFRILELRDGAYREVYNSRDEVMLHVENFKTNDFRIATNSVITSVDAKISGKADKAWGKYTSTGEDVVSVYGSNTVYITEPTMVIAGGMEYRRFAVGEGAVCILTSKGAPTYTQGEEGVFKFQDTGGTNYFGFAKTDSYEIGANASGISVVNNMVTITYDVTMSGVPCMWYKADVGGTNAWEKLNNPDGTSIPGASHVPSWVQNPPEGKKICNINVTGDARGFFRASIEVSGIAKFITNMPADLSGGVLCTDGTTIIFPHADGTWSTTR